MILAFANDPTFGGWIAIGAGFVIMIGFMLYCMLAEPKPDDGPHYWDTY